MKRLNHRISFGLGILGLAAAGTAAAFLAFASGGKAASSNTCTQLAPAQANCLFVSAVPSVLSEKKTGLLVVRFKNTFANATTTHTVLKANLPTAGGVLVSSVTASTGVQCSSATISCPIGSVPGGAIVSMYVRYTTSLSAGSTLGAFQGFVSFDESNGNTGNTTNDSFETDSGTTSIVAPINNGAGGAQAGLCAGPTDLSQTAFTTNSNGQQAIVGQLPGFAPGLPCTPVSGGVRDTTGPENKACGGSCPFPTSFVFFPVLTNNVSNNAADLLTLNYPTLPPGVNSAKKTPLYEFVPDPTPTDPLQLKLVQVLKCGLATLSPDSCLVSDPVKFGSSGVSFTVSVTGSELDGSYVP
jgi:hypothetical protein